MKKWLKSEICGFYEQYINALFTEDLVNNLQLGKKEEVKNAERGKCRRANVLSKHLLGVRLDTVEKRKQKTENTVAK